MRYDELKTGMLVATTSGWHIFYVEQRINEDGDIKVCGIDLNDPYWGTIWIPVDESDSFIEIHDIGTKEYSEALVRIYIKRNNSKLDAEKDCLIIQGFLGNDKIVNTGGGGGVDEKFPKIQNEIHDTEWS